MSVLDQMNRILVVAPHPDDEVLGCGGVITKLVDAGKHVEVVIVAQGFPPRFEPEFIERGLREAATCHEFLGIEKTHWVGFPAVELDGLLSADINNSLSQLVAEMEPDTVFLPFAGDLHVEHQIVATAGLVAVRANKPTYPARVYAYETLSETNWNAPYLAPAFQPNVFIDIADSVERKIQAMKLYASQVAEFPNERSPEAIRALAVRRGSTVHRHAAEAFVLLREVG